MEENEIADNKFTWVIKNFSSQFRSIISDEFVIGGYRWFLNVGKNAKYLSLYLWVANDYIPCGWRRHIRSSVTVVNQISEKLSIRRETQSWLDDDNIYHGYSEMISRTKLNAKKGGFIVNDEIKIVVEVDVLQVIGGLDVAEASQEVPPPSKRIKLDGDGGAVSNHLHNETSLVDVNGFQVLPSQVQSVKRIFERHPDMALEFRAKNQPLRTSCINVLLNLIETLQDFSTDDLGQAKKALTYLKDSGFKVDWLELKLEEVKEKKMEEQFGKTQMQKLEEMKVFKQKCSDIEAMRETQLSQQLSPGGSSVQSTSLPTAEAHKFFEEVATKKKGKIIGLGSIRDVSVASSSFVSRHDLPLENNPAVLRTALHQIQAKISEMQESQVTYQEELQEINSIFEIIGLVNPDVAHALRLKRQRREEAQTARRAAAACADPTMPNRHKASTSYSNRAYRRST